MTYLTEIPKAAGRVVSTCIYNGAYIIACEYAVYSLKIVYNPDDQKSIHALYPLVLAEELK